MSIIQLAVVAPLVVMASVTASIALELSGNWNRGVRG